MTGIIEFSTDTLNIEVSGIDQNIPIDLVEVISTGQDVYVNLETSQGVLTVNGRQGLVTLDKSDVGLENVENLSITGVSGFLQYQIDQLDTGYASQVEIDLLSGNLIITGANLTSLINSLSGYGQSSYYSINNPSGFITGVDLSSYATISNLNSTGNFLQSQINDINNSGFITGIDLTSYATNANLAISGSTLANSIAATGSDLQSQINNLDSVYATDASVSGVASNLGITGATLQNDINTVVSNLDLTGSTIQGNINIISSNLVATGENLQNQLNNLDSSYASQVEFDILSGDLISTGQFLDQKINDLSGVAVLTYGDQYIDGQKIFRGEVRIKDLYVTGSQTIVNTTSTNVGSNYILLNATGGAIDAGIFIVTSDGLTGISDTGAIIGYDVPANRWVFGNASRSDDLSQLEPIAGITNITNYSGFASANYATILNLENTGSNLQNQIDNINNSGFITGVDLSNYYTKDNPSGFITGVDLSPYLTGVDLSNYYTNDNPSGFITGVDLSNYYTNDNPSGFITGVDLSNYVTKIGGEFIDRPTVNGTGVLLSGEAAGSANFRYFPASGVANLLSNNRYSFDTLTGLVTGILPASPQKGDEIELYDSAGTWHINPLVVDNNGNYIEQKKEMLECNVRHGLIKLIYTTQNNIGWRIYPMPIHNVPLLLLPPIPAISTSSISGFAPLTLTFTGINLQTPAEFSPVDHWYWNVSGDSTPEFDQSVITYTFNETGNYTFYLTAVNSGGSGIASGTFSILEVPQFSGDSYSDYVTLLLHFN